MPYEVIMSFGYPRYRLIDRGALAGCFPWSVNGEMLMILGKIRRETGDVEGVLGMAWVGVRNLA